MTKETFNNIIDVIASRLLDEKREQGKRYNPFSIKDAGSPDYDIWAMLTNNKAYATRLANRIQKALWDRLNWNVAVSIVYGDQSTHPRDYNVYVEF